MYSVSPFWMLENAPCDFSLSHTALNFVNATNDLGPKLITHLIDNSSVIVSKYGSKTEDERMLIDADALFPSF